jgi:hypothetical protein
MERTRIKKVIMELENTLECLVDPELAARVDQESGDKDVAQHTAPAGLHADAHWEADATDDEEDDLEYSDEECIGGEDEENALEKELVDSLRLLMHMVKGSSAFDAKHVHYHWGPQPNGRTVRRHKAADRELKADAQTSKKLNNWLLHIPLPSESEAHISPTPLGKLKIRAQIMSDRREETIKELEHLLRTKTSLSMILQNYEWHKTVLGFLRMQQKRRPGRLTSPATLIRY